jgi:hypothetical protein
MDYKGVISNIAFYASWLMLVMYMPKGIYNDSLGMVIWSITLFYGLICSLAYSFFGICPLVVLGHTTLKNFFNRLKYHYGKYFWHAIVLYGLYPILYVVYIYFIFY